MTLQSARARQLYNRDAILSASPVRLLTMIYDRLLLDLHRAEKAQESADWQTASDCLLHAQDIIAELNATLKSGIWDGAEGLRSLYDYVRRALVSANVNRNPSLTREAIELLEPLRQSWHQAAASLPAERPQLTAIAGGYVG